MWPLNVDSNYMIYSKYTPKGILETYVQSMWYCHDYSPLSKKERILPNGASQLIINLGSNKFCHFEGADNNEERKYSSVIIAGIHTSNIFLDSFSRLSTMGVVLRPGALPALFDIASNEFKNQIVALESIAVSGISKLRGRLIEATSPEEKFSLLETFLLGQLDRSFQPNPAIIYSIDQLKNRNGSLPVAEIRDKVGYSHRRFSELFKQLVGISPKQYARICRFQHTLGKIRAIKVPDWSTVAINSGYYDQPHFIHEFKSFSGLSPTEYYHNQSDEMNHLPA